MSYVAKDTLIKVRGRLCACLDLMHDEANASAKEEVIQAIATIDKLIESEDHLRRAAVYELVGKIIEKLPWLLSLMRDLD